MRTLLLTGLLAGIAAAQMTDVPPVVQIVRKPGIGAASPQPYADAKAAIEVVGITAMTGVPETWMIEWHNSFMSIQGLDNAMAPGRSAVRAEASGASQDDVLSPARTMIATYRQELSYRPQDAIRLLARARYFHVSIFRVQPGQDDNLMEVMTIRRATMDSVNLARPDLVYHVLLGETASVYVVLAPLVSLKIMDDGIAALPTYAEPIAAAEAKARKKASDVVLTREHFLFRVDPTISYVSDEFAAGDVEFWRGKRQQ